MTLTATPPSTSFPGFLTHCAECNGPAWVVATRGPVGTRPARSCEDGHLVAAPGYYVVPDGMTPPAGSFDLE